MAMSEAPSCPVAGKQFAPEEFRQVLRKLVESASKYLSETVTQAMITVQRVLNDSSVKPTEDAGPGAGIEVPTDYQRTHFSAYGFTIKIENHQCLTLVMVRLTSPFWRLGVVCLSVSHLW